MPSLADIMSIMQWRHLKLAYNWPLAAFEVGANATEPFRSSATLSRIQGSSAGAARQGRERAALAEVAKAIELKNSAYLAKTYRKLTNACNHCHQTAGVGFIVISIPTRSPFSNQQFAPKE